MGSHPQELSIPRDEIDDDELLALQVLRMTNTVAFPMVLKSALELGVIDVIYGEGNGDQFLSASEIVDRLPRKPTTPQAPLLLNRILHHLTTYSILNSREVQTGQTTERLYGAKPICKHLLTKNQGSISFRPLHLMFNHRRYLESWCHLSNAILEGENPFEEAHGMTLYEFIERDESFNILFHDAMVSYTTLVMSKLLKVYKGFEGLDVVIDVGGGTGTVSGIITKMYPKTKAICYDMPHVIASAPSYPGVEFVAGDIFVNVPHGDAVFIKSVLHGCGDEVCLKILRNCRNAIPKHGKVIVMEPVLDAVSTNDVCSKLAADMDVLMLNVCRGGKQRNLKEFEDLASKSGFSSCQLVCTAYHFGLLEFYK